MTFDKSLTYPTKIDISIQFYPLLYFPFAYIFPESVSSTSPHPIQCLHRVLCCHAVILMVISYHLRKELVKMRLANQVITMVREVANRG